MHTVKLVLEYDGTDFVGWQVQPNGRSVQEAIERALGTLLGGTIRVVGSGRTDAGVHARGQVASFRTDRDLPLRAYVHGMNALLPKDVAVVSAELAPEGFDARRSASGKRYVYRISTKPVRSPLRRRTHWEIFQPLDRAAMREAAGHLLGEHDFSAFRASDCPARTTVRTLRALELREGDDEIVVVAEATAYLKHMVRNLVGTLVEVGLGKRAPGSMPALLASGDRRQAGRTAPPQGLALDEVFYEGR
ncbi:MAG TPA: tRNA pseudouridine(38-40) synthase TruA [Vulgatibacter sp.]|nr:tRNA pseudouridine(38-40) synthase TruA [Vulgatibacter sp.]